MIQLISFFQHHSSASLFSNAAGQIVGWDKEEWMGTWLGEK